jgi:hypothetical protein
MSATLAALRPSRKWLRPAALLVLLGITFVVVPGPWNKTPDQLYEWYFNESVHRLYPTAYDILAHDHALRAEVLQGSKAAYDQGGWPASSQRFWLLMLQKVQIYAGDSSTRTCQQAWNGVARKLLETPALCRAFLLGDRSDELVSNRADAAYATCAAAQRDGAQRRLAGARPELMSHDDEAAIYRRSFSAPSPLTAAERAALVSAHPDDRLFCSANIRLMQNTESLPDDRYARYIRTGWSTQAQVLPLSDVLPDEPPPPALACAAPGTIFTLSMEAGRTGLPITWTSVGQKGWDCQIESSATGARGLWGEPRENPIRLLWPLKIGSVAQFTAYSDANIVELHQLRVVDEQLYWLPIGVTHGFAIDEVVSVGGQTRYVLTHYWSPELGFKIGQRLVVEAGERPENIAPDWQVIASEQKARGSAPGPR